MGIEDAIRVVIVLFVAVAVAGIVILFSQGLLGNARNNLNRLGEFDVEEDQIVELDAVRADDLINLANECVRQNYATFEKRTCFVVLGDTFPAVSTYDGRTLESNFTTNASGVGTDFNAIILTFDPGEDEVLLTT